MDEVRQRILRECARTGFAEVARYSVPRAGKAIVGPSIRFAEAAIRCMGNVSIEAPTLYDDDDKRILRVNATDLETNATYSLDVTVAKTVERKETRGEVLGTRKNSYGEMVYIVRATEDDLTTKQAALVSKAIRTLALRLVPGDIVEEAMAAVRATLSRADGADPEATRKKIADAFFSLGVSVAALKQYLGHEIASASPTELADLRMVYASIRDGEATWTETMATRSAVDATGEPAPAPTTRRGAAREATRKAKAAAAPAPTPAPAQAAPATPAPARSHNPEEQDAPPDDK
jgi:hypothetical protein